MTDILTEWFDIKADFLKDVRERQQVRLARLARLQEDGDRRTPGQRPARSR